MTTLQPTRVDLLIAEDANELVVRARGGCEDAYTELAKRYFPRLVQLVLPRMLHNIHMDAEDIAQESLARAFKNLEKFDPNFRFSTWLYTISLRVCADHNRGHRRRSSLLKTHRSTLELEGSLCGHVYAKCEQQENAETIWRMARAVLGETQYTALWLRFAEDLSVAEIARVMQKTKVGVRVLLHRARVKMFKELNEQDAAW